MKNVVTNSQFVTLHRPVGSNKKPIGPLLLPNVLPPQPPVKYYSDKVRLYKQQELISKFKTTQTSKDIMLTETFQKH